MPTLLYQIPPALRQLSKSSTITPRSGMHLQPCRSDRADPGTDPYRRLTPKHTRFINRDFSLLILDLSSAKKEKELTRGKTKKKMILLAKTIKYMQRVNIYSVVPSSS